MRQLVAGIAASHGLTAETVTAIVAKSDGVPLFVEELTKSMMEAAGEDGAAVPATLKDSLRRGSIASPRHARWRRSLRSLAGNSRLLCSTRLHLSVTQRSKPVWRSWLRQASSFPKAAARNGATVSSMHWCETWLTKVYCCPGGAAGMNT
jgi:hypothetical protein